ncbi:hypothetical protein LH384_34635, partial [Pseudomonas aeruginosa]|nr:hypothetical protein [Pseudomonas aeruginosa]
EPFLIEHLGNAHGNPDPQIDKVAGMELENAPPAYHLVNIKRQRLDVIQGDLFVSAPGWDRPAVADEMLPGVLWFSCYYI